MRQRSGKGQGVRACVDELVTELIRLLPDAFVQGRAKAIHDARVATRRLTAVVDVFEPVLKDRHRRPFVKALRRIRRRLRDLRDLDVQIDHLQRVRSPIGIAPAAQWVLIRLRRRRQTLFAKISTRFDLHEAVVALGTSCALRDDLSQAPDAIDPCLARSLHAQFTDFARLADRLLAPQPTVAGSADADGHRDADPGLSASEGDAGDATPHALRIAGKLLRYTLEIARADGHPVAPAARRTYKRMQDLLGLWHDYVVLSDVAVQLALDQCLSLRDPVMHRQVLRLTQDMARRAQNQWQWFGRLWRAKHLGLRDAILAIFPAATPAVAVTDAAPAPLPDTTPFDVLLVPVPHAAAAPQSSSRPGPQGRLHRT